MVNASKLRPPSRKTRLCATLPLHDDCATLMHRPGKAGAGKSTLAASLTPQLFAQIPSFFEMPAADEGIQIVTYGTP